MQEAKDALALAENLNAVIATRQETWAILLFAYGATTAIIYGVINDVFECSRGKTWKRLVLKVLIGFLFLVVLYNSFSACQRFLLWWRG